jgi:hypothetical protein
MRDPFIGRGRNKSLIDIKSLVEAFGLKTRYPLIMSGPFTLHKANIESGMYDALVGDLGLLVREPQRYIAELYNCLNEIWRKFENKMKDNNVKREQGIAFGSLSAGLQNLIQSVPREYLMGNGGGNGGANNGNNQTNTQQQLPDNVQRWYSAMMNPEQKKQNIEFFKGKGYTWDENKKWFVKQLSGEGYYSIIDAKGDMYRHDPTKPAPSDYIPQGHVLDILNSQYPGI